MKRIVNGRVYNTETAEVICDCSPSGFYGGDFRVESTTLYKSPKGTFFIAGKGGPLSRWAEPEGQSGMRSGEGLRVLDEAEARELCERHGSEEDWLAAFGEPEEG